MTSEVLTTTPDAPLGDAARVLVEHKIGCLPVVEAGRLVGIITEGDFVALAARKN
jgi:CBS domain-containing protein